MVLVKFDFHKSMILKHDHFTLSHFEGSLDFLICLIQKEEIDIYDVSIQEIIQQFIHKLQEGKDSSLEKGAEFIGTAAYLVWLKSQTLLPREEQTINLEEIIEDPQFAIIHHLIDYCRFKQTAKALSLRQEQQQACYFRGIDIPEGKKPLGIDHLSLEELAQLFKEMMQRSNDFKPQIYEENWRVSDKIRGIRHQLREQLVFPLIKLLSPEQSKMEMIVTFLALLELMKIGELTVGRNPDSQTLLVFAKEEEIHE